jgi:predicted nucleic acid-binding Zn ribbon protein
MICPNCGKEIANDSQFCEFCGATIKENASNNSKQVNIRWALLPTMILTTIAVWSHYESGNQCIRIDFDAFVTFLPSLIILILSLWQLIRKKITWVFFLIIGVLFLSNAVMFYEIIYSDPGESMYYKTIYWNEGEDNYSIQLSSIERPDSRGCFHEKDTEKANKAILTCEEYILSSLRNQKNVQIDSGNEEISRTSIHKHYESIGESCFMIAMTLSLLYILYALIARKKNWKY